MVYDNTNRLIRKIDPNGVETSMEYDINDAVKSGS
ncbi:MAG: RHS repeat protein [Chitinophagaceae bacterium]|nr:RHS repeat protein [Chitinophagaceae bacterium]